VEAAAGAAMDTGDVLRKTATMTDQLQHPQVADTKNNM